MLWTLVLVLAALWLVGMLTSYTFSGLLHLLLVVAVIVLVVRMVQGRKALT